VYRYERVQHEPGRWKGREAERDLLFAPNDDEDGAASAVQTALWSGLSEASFRQDVSVSFEELAAADGEGDKRMDGRSFLSAAAGNALSIRQAPMWSTWRWTQMR
jgi:hypothetical protein